ncbi:hypothetical protein [Limimaricola litoreus]|uniref:Uncharacterized protein n=1 Tax=Limimaricola litoreus TaxID=2955316 RepID=A0A9X2FRW0_9RHOB|nr:hypothetical protein [Limimaricola litoreus]MCP1168924.1 hypothetical protein [Limimaricola litoreus]
MEPGVGRRSATVVLAVTLQRLLDDPERAWSVEEALVLDALRRSSTALDEASPKELADYMAGLEPEQLRGVISNVKGIYHELLFAAAENADGDAVFARLPDATNHPGSDVEFVVDGEVIGAVQLKAVAAPEHVYEHLANYPGIEVLSTEEVAAMIPGVSGSGFANTELEAEVRAALGALPGESLPQDLLEAAEASLFVSAALTARGALRAGRVEPRALKAAMGNLGVGLTTALALDVLLGGV